jgi:hypothetical protein
VVQKHVIPSRSTQKYFSPTLEVNTKNIPYTISTKKNTPSSCCISQKFCCKKETCGYAKVIHKKRERESIKNG